MGRAITSGTPFLTTRSGPSTSTLSAPPVVSHAATPSAAAERAFMTVSVRPVSGPGQALAAVELRAPSQSQAPLPARAVGHAGLA